MATAKGPKPPSYRRHKARGQAFVQLKGKRYHLGAYGSEESREGYQRFLAEAWAKPQVSEPRSRPDQITVIELAAAFWSWANVYYRRNGAPTGQVSLVKSALRPLRQLYGSFRAADFGPLSLEAVRRGPVVCGVGRGGPEA